MLTTAIPDNGLEELYRRTIAIKATSELFCSKGRTAPGGNQEEAPKMGVIRYCTFFIL